MVSHFHTFLVFVPKYRRRMFDADALERLRNAFRVVCADFEADLVRRYWRGGLWSASYFMASVGGAPLSIL